MNWSSQPPCLKPSSSRTTPSSETFSVITIFPISVLLVCSSDGGGCRLGGEGGLGAGACWARPQRQPGERSGQRERGRDADRRAEPGAEGRRGRVVAGAGEHRDGDREPERGAELAGGA